MDVIFLLSSFLLFSITYFFLRFIWEKIQIRNLTRKPVFITGCDSGFGYHLAIKCLSRGMPVFAGCFSQQGVDKLINDSKNYNGSLNVFLLDVTNDVSVNNVRNYLESATAEYGGLHAVVNNAGIVGNSFFSDFLTIKDYKEVCEVNLFGVIRVTEAFKSLVKRTKGRIVTVSSICSRVGIMGIGPYTVSKFGVSGYCDVIRQELRMWGVSVHVLEPGFFRTPLIDKTNIERQLDQVWLKCPQQVQEEYGEQFFREGREKTNDLLQGISSPHIEWVVDAYFHAITAYFPRLRYQIGWDANFLFIPLSFIPSRIQDVIFSFTEKAIRLPQPKMLQKI
ncbi:unnamed protein product [Auanema sp. JU1783]|nr:unnamed protein product [Auanema sp. JU1783]